MQENWIEEEGDLFAHDHKTNAASSKQLLIRTDIKTKNKTDLICKLFDENGVSNTSIFELRLLFSDPLLRKSTWRVDFTNTLFWWRTQSCGATVQIVEVHYCYVND